MFADPKKVGLRRIKRHLKAGASIVLAMAAGAFLACQKNPPSGQEGNPAGPDGRRGQGASSGGANADAGVANAGVANAGTANAQTNTDAGRDAQGTAGVDAGETGLVVADAGDAGLAVRDAQSRTHRVDRQEHRSGMPVRDNLLE